jgi:hypothetical protein
MLASVPRIDATPTAMRKTKWDSNEDQLLIDAVAAHGTGSWAKIATYVPDRTSKQCRERWLGRLSPAVHQAPWTAEEDTILVQRHAFYGNRWTNIALGLPGRSVIAVKNRWGWLQRRRIFTVAQLWLLPRQPDVHPPGTEETIPKPKAVLFDPREKQEDIFGSRFREFQATMMGLSLGRTRST